MEVKSTDTQGEAVIAPEETKVAPEVKVAETVEPAAPTVGEVIKEATPEPKAEVVGLDKFLELKKENKKLKTDFKALEAKISEGASASEVSSDIDEIAEEYGVDKSFLKRLTKTIQAQAEQDVQERLKPFTEKEKAAQIDSAFNKHYKAAIDKMPDFADIANPDVIKTLSLDPKNAHKTFSQIIEETYGSALSGKRTIETTRPGGGKEPAPLDFQKARKDGKYFDEVMADPKLKAEYNAKMLQEGF